MNKAYVEDCTTLSPREALGGCRQSNIECWLDPSELDVLFVSIGGQEPQRLILEQIDLTFGPMVYFVCGCGYRALKLYLPPKGTRFACRSCQKLGYRGSGLNPKSVAGKAIHQIERISKLADTRASMSRIFYRGQYTRRFNRFLTQCGDAGLNSIVDDARDLLDILKTQGIPTNAGH